jgi:hypothetical protein
VKIVPPFWVDASSLVEAHRRKYRDKRHEFWGFLSSKVTDGSVCSPMQVYEELLKGKAGDYLINFGKSRPGMKVFANRSIFDAYRVIAGHVAATYEPKRWEEFLGGGDAWVIAFAMRMGGTVVTEESASRKKKIRIPPVCEALVVCRTAPVAGEPRNSAEPILETEDL